VELVLCLVIVYTLDNLGPDQRASRDDTLNGYHVVEVVGRQSPGIAGMEAKAASPGTVIHDLIVSLVWPRLGDSLDDLFEGMVECEGVVEGVDEEAICDLRVMVTDVIYVDD
jgi:hypothetical protein